MRAPGAGNTRPGATGTGNTTGTPGTGASGASARLRGPRRCVKVPFTARVTGRQIARVTFYVDGKHRRTVKATDGQTLFSLHVNPLEQNLNKHRITAKVRFTTPSGAKLRTLRLVYQRCSTAATEPRFTG